MIGKTADYLEKVLKPISHVVNGIGTAILLLMVLLIGTNVALRYLIRKPIKGSVELEEFLLVVLVFFGVAYTAVKKRHIKIELVISRLSPSIKTMINAITQLLSFVLSALMVWQTVVYAKAQWQYEAESIILNLPLFPFIFVVAFGSALLGLALLVEFLRSLEEIAKNRRWFSFGAALSLVLLLFALVALLRPPPEAMALIAFGFLILFLALGMHIVFVMILVGFLGISYLHGLSAGLHHIGTAPYVTIAQYSLCVVAFFMLMGYVASEAGINRDIYYTTHRWFGHLPGGLAMATVWGCAGFGAVCGDSFATSAVMGAASLPEMKRFRYDPGLATGSVAAGGTLGTLIPPSIAMIFYCIITGQSINKLFIAGILPGLLLASLFMLIIYGRSRLNPDLAPPGPKTSFKEKIVSLKRTWAMLLLFVLVIGGIYAGIFTPNEAGAIGACGALLIGLAKRMFSWKKLFSALTETGQTVAMLLIILVGAIMFGYFLAASKAPFFISDFVSGLSLNRYITLILILLVYVFLGCVMNIVPAMIITLPIFYPTILNLGFDPIWFGVIMVIIINMGMITPPIGMNVFVIKGVAKDVPLETIFRGIVPFILAMILCLIILTIFPQIALFLPGLMK
ncbi:MAG: TRAP transporter large permease subunit [Candidatus Aminicenantaceae bacterium]